MVEGIAAMAGILSELASLASSASEPSSAAPQSASASAPGASFGDLFNAAVGRLDHTVSGAGAAAQAFAAGKDDIPLSDVMISLEQANLGLQLAGNIRDKVAAAYSSIMNMQL